LPRSAREGYRVHVSERGDAERAGRAGGAEHSGGDAEVDCRLGGQGGWKRERGIADTKVYGGSECGEHHGDQVSGGGGSDGECEV